MKFVYYFPGLTVPPNTALMSADVPPELAVLAEQTGFSAVALDEHPAPPESWRKDPAGHDSIDPFVAPSRLRRRRDEEDQTVHASRHRAVPQPAPQKAAATLDVVSQGRLMFDWARATSRRSSARSASTSPSATNSSTSRSRS